MTHGITPTCIIPSLISLFSPEPLNMLGKYLQSALKHQVFVCISRTSEKQAEYPGTAA